MRQSAMRVSAESERSPLLLYDQTVEPIAQTVQQFLVETAVFNTVFAFHDSFPSMSIQQFVLPLFVHHRLHFLIEIVLVRKDSSR